MEEMYDMDLPKWLINGRVDESLFCQCFLMTHDLICVGGTFFTPEGRVGDEGTLRKEIYDTLKGYVFTGLGRKVDSILDTLRLECWRRELPYQNAVIHVANGTYHLQKGFSENKFYCRYRLPVSYRPNCPGPSLWLQFVEELLEPEDIPTLQEFMGYCLIPTTMAQKMLIILGKGGEGKSRIGVVMKEMLGVNMNMGSVAKLESSPFARADLEHVLLMVDDDLKMESLQGTNYIKSIVTADVPMDLERKGIQSYQGRLCARLMAFGNGALHSKNDKSYGFFRRQIILTAKERNPDRVDDPYLGERLKQEIDGIFLWCLLGLYRLIDNDFRFTISQKAKENMDKAIMDTNNAVEFIRSEGYVRLNPKGSASSRGLYSVYMDWCEDNALTPISAKAFWSFLSQSHSTYGLTPTCHIPLGNGKECRGFLGIEICGR